MYNWKGGRKKKTEKKQQQPPKNPAKPLKEFNNTAQENNKSN